MNRLDMAEEIAKRVPMLAQRDKREWKEAERLRTDFIADYPIKRIQSLSLDEYVIGKGAGNRSFCYRIEREMDTLGKIVGATAFKFGIYFGRTTSDPARHYRYASRWGRSHNEAFKAVKQAIVNLIQAADKKDFVAIVQNSLSPMLKGKILFIYYPEQFAPIYARQHLEHFIAELNLGGAFECEVGMQRALMEYRSIWPELVAESPALYMRFLYDLFGYPPGTNISGTAAAPVPILAEALEGAEFITEMPVSTAVASSASGRKGKTDYEARQRNSKRVGERGELIVYDLEKKRLIKLGKHKLANNIEHIAELDDSAGYDILSFDEDGTERRIEVKATSAPDFRLGFYITANELAKAAELHNYYIYFVFSAMSTASRTLPVKHPDLKSAAYKMCPINFHVTLSNH